MKKILLGAIALLATHGTVLAADLYQPSEPIPIAPVQQVEVSSAGGWYLRGDAAYSYNKSLGAWFHQGGAASDETDFTRSDLRSSFSVGGGIGYQVNNYLRTDVTMDYMFNGDFKGSTHGSCGVAGACTSTDIASMKALSLLANAYVDIGTWGYVTPYVGAGIGGTHVKWGDLSNTSCDDSNSSNCDPTETHGGNGNWRFTYALMAGASIDVTCNLKADVGYRYRRVEGGRMFDYKNSGGPGYDRGFDSHEGRVGMRYIFDGCQEQAYIPPVEPPIYK